SSWRDPRWSFRSDRWTAPTAARSGTTGRECRLPVIARRSPSLEMVRVATRGRKPRENRSTRPGTRSVGSVARPNEVLPEVGQLLPQSEGDLQPERLLDGVQLDVVAIPP